MIESYKAVRKILESIKKDPKDPNSPPLFRTIKLDNGQLNRIKNNSANKEYGILFLRYSFIISIFITMLVHRILLREKARCAYTMFLID